MATFNGIFVITGDVVFSLGPTVVHSRPLVIQAITEKKKKKNHGDFLDS